MLGELEIRCLVLVNDHGRNGKQNVVMDSLRNYQIIPAWRGALRLVDFRFGITSVFKTKATVKHHTGNRIIEY